MKKKTIRVVQKLVEKSVRRFTQDLATSAFQNSGLAFDLEAVDPPFFQCISGKCLGFLIHNFAECDMLSPHTGGLVGQLI